MATFSRRAVLHVGATLLGAEFCRINIGSANAISASPREAYEIAIEAYLYFYPLISMETTRRIATNLPANVKEGFGPMNAFSHMRSYPDANFRTVVRPNFDTLYSSAYLDLTDGPVIISAPDTHDRYYMLPLLDMWSEVFAVPGKRTTGTKAAAFAVIPPGWTGVLPLDVERIDAPTYNVWIIGRTQTNGPEDYEAVHGIQDGYKLTPLAQWGQLAISPEALVDPTIDMMTPPKVQVDAMKPAEYFRSAAELFKANPPHITDWSLVERMQRIGFVRGNSFDLATFDTGVRTAIEQGAADAFKLMEERAPSIGRIVNGWQMNTDTIGVFGNYYLKRAIVARIGLGANQPEDAIYPLCVADGDGKALTGDRRYVLHFRREEIPPVRAFWSLTMYDAEGFPVANPLNRFSIGDRNPLVFNADGSLDLYVQHDDPGADRQANWLPAPAAGALGLTMRLYAPRPEALDGRWDPPVVKAI